MDWTELLQQRIVLYTIVGVVLALVVITRTPWSKGMVGEGLVNLGIRLRLNREHYRLLKDLTLPIDRGTTQIDHIIVSRYGVFILETKNMAGWIFGSSDQKQWLQKIYKNSFKFQNPLHQNHKHVKAVQQLLGLENGLVHSVVVFVGRCRLKTAMPANVVIGSQLIRYLKSFRESVLTSSDMERITSMLEEARLAPGLQTRTEHVRHVEDMLAQKKLQLRCPICGGAMVLRRARQGPNAGSEFFGCKRFPQCRGTVSGAEF